MQASELLVMRHRVPDATLLDALELRQLLPDLPCRVRRSDLEAHWQVTQPALHRRLRRLQHAGLLDYETEHGTIWVNRIGPPQAAAITACNGLRHTSPRCHAESLPWVHRQAERAADHHPIARHWPEEP